MGQLAIATLEQPTAAGNGIGKHAALAAAQLGSEVGGELRRTVDRLAGVEHAPAIKRVHTLLAQIRRGGEQGLLHIAGAHPRESLPDLGGRAGHRGSGGRGAVHIMAVGKCGAGYRADQMQTRSDKAEGGGIATGI